MTQETNHDLEIIMAQTMSAKPLETLQHRFLVWLQTLILSRLLPTATLCQRRVRAAWRTLCGREAYQGARYLPDEEAIPWQCRMAHALGSSDRALIVIRFGQWIEHNKSEGRAATTHNGYDAWIEKHFWHLKPGAFGGHIRALEKMGVLKTQRIGQVDPGRKYDQRKSYRIDYGRLNALIAAVKKPTLDTETKKSNTPAAKSKTREANSNLNNDSNSSNQVSDQSLKPKSSTQEPPTKPGRGGRRAGAGRKPKHQEALTDKNTASTAPVLSTAALPETPPVEAQSPAAPIEDSPIPNSAKPLPHAEAALIERMGTLDLDEERAAALIDHYGADRVRAVVRECQQRCKPDAPKPVHIPSGWIIRELENDVFKLGSMTVDEYDQAAGNWLSRFAMTIEDMEDDSDSHTLITESLPETVPPDSVAVTRWNKALKRLEVSMQTRGPAVFFNTVNASELIRFDAEEPVYVVRTQTPDHAQRSRFHITMILEALEQIHGGPCRVEFEAR